MLKIKTVLSILALTATVLLSSCKDEDVAPTLGNFTIDGRTTSLIVGYVFPDDDPTYKMDETLIYSHRFYLEGKPEDGSIVFSLISNSSICEPGTYTFVSHDYLNQYSAMELYSLRIDETDNTHFSDITEGTVKLSRNGNKYIFDIDAMLDGLVVTGSFEGDLEIVE